MEYKKGSKIKNKHTGEMYIINGIHVEETPAGETVVYEARSRKKNVPNEGFTGWMLEKYFEVQ